MGNLATFFSLIGFLWSNGDHVMRLLDALMGQLPAVGQGIEVAGQRAKEASYGLKGGGGVTVNARQAVDLAAQAVDTCYQRVDAAAGAIRDVRDRIRNVKVPSLEASSAGVQVPIINVDISVPTLNFTETSPFEPAADYLSTEAQRVDEAGAQLQAAAGRLRDLRDALNSVGGDLHTLGAKLEEGGRILKQMGS